MCRGECNNQFHNHKLNMFRNGNDIRDLDAISSSESGSRHGHSCCLFRVAVGLGRIGRFRLDTLVSQHSGMLVKKTKRKRIKYITKNTSYIKSIPEAWQSIPSLVAATKFMQACPRSAMFRRYRDQSIRPPKLPLCWK